VIRTLPVELNDREATAFRESARVLSEAMRTLKLPAAKGRRR
jgi:hypothetical protein